MDQILIGVAAALSGVAIGASLVELTWQAAKRKFQGQEGHAEPQHSRA